MYAGYLLVLGHQIEKPATGWACG